MLLLGRYLPGWTVETSLVASLSRYLHCCVSPASYDQDAPEVQP